MISVTLASQRFRFELLSWIDGRSLRSPHARDFVMVPKADGTQERAMVSPDGYFCVRLASRKDGGSYLSHNFVKADRSMVSGTVWAKRVVIYMLYHSSEPPAGELEQQIESFLSAGEPVTLPEELLSMLIQRRSQATKLGPWVKRHERPPRKQ